jgi:hypothetical protein
LSRRPLEIIVNPGDVIFVPHGWWHMVINLEESIAITQNYVSDSNLTDVLSFLKNTPDQISGVRDRCGEAIQPEDMFCSFVSHLEDKFPTLLREKWTDVQASSVKAAANVNHHLSRIFDKKRKRTPVTTNACISPKLADVSDIELSTKSSGFSFSFSILD